MISKIFKQSFIVCSSILLLSQTGFAEEEVSIDTNTSTKTTDGFTVKGMPTLSSNPTSGTGIGATGVGIYKADKNSSPSQVILTGQYTNTDSWNLFLINKMFFGADKWQSNSLLGYIYTNNENSIPSDIEIPIGLPISPDEQIKYNVEIYVAYQQFLYEVANKFYFGPQVLYIDQKFNATNELGKAFLQTNGIKDSSRGGFGFTLNYDSRTKSEKFYPTNSSFVGFMVSDFPEWLGIDEEYFNAILNARKYIHGFKEDDVFAMQFFAQYSSEDTPDGALAGLGARNILRGFPIGLHKTRHMLASQGEYRYLISNTSFRLTAFGGFANLSGGSKGDGNGNNRDGDNGNYYSGGLGVHYILEKNQGLDYRVNIAYTNEKETSVYASINQAF
jgi:hypothetical protein